MDAPRFDRFATAISARLTRRTGLGLLAGASLPLFGLGGVAEARKKKKVTLCVNRQTVQTPKKKAKKLLQQGATKGACPAGCTSGQKACRNACIPNANCCVDNDCTSDERCENGECVSLRCGNGGPCAVFVSTNSVQGTAVGGVAGGDLICQTAANNAGLSGRQFKAWLSTATETPSSRFATSGPYVLVRNASDGANPPPTVADNFADLITCVGSDCLKSPISRTETGDEGVSTEVWTGTDENGNVEPATCSNWTNGGGSGQVGATNSASPTWTSSSAETCIGFNRSLYCFEQAT